METRNLRRIRRLDPRWTLPSMMDQNPLVRLVDVNGLPIDIPMAQTELQHEALRLGLISYRPGGSDHHFDHKEKMR
jgi:hypothetical protein